MMLFQNQKIVLGKKMKSERGWWKPALLAFREVNRLYIQLDQFGQDTIPFSLEL